MGERLLYNILLVILLVSAAGSAGVLSFIPAPYGRHLRAGWGPTVGNRLGWVMMEAPAAVVFAACFALGEYRNTPTAWAFFIMWEAHYIHRSFIYPFELKSTRKRMPVFIAGLGFLFNMLNGYVNGRYLYTFSGGYPTRWLADPRFIAGLLIFLAGFTINRQADRTLRNLRECNASGYAIPYGGLYRWLSCPNYFGEIVEWCGWALATWSLPGLLFAVWTAANLAPRAQSHHAWYRAHFHDYPPQRKALVPGLW